MTGVRFADVLFIILICLLIWGITMVVNRAKRKKYPSDNENTREDFQGGEES